MFGVFEVDGSAEPVEKFNSGGEAASAARVWNEREAQAGSDTRFKVRPIIDDTWKERERQRLAYGEYVRLPDEVHRMAQGDRPEHYAHASQSELGFVAFTASPEKGAQDRQTRKRAGAYLREFWPDLSDAEVQRLALICDNEAAPRVLELAEGADEFERVYVDGPGSCMGYSADSYESSVHPVRAYGGPDLSIGYIELDGKITGRAVCWPDASVHGVIYGDIERMEQALSDAGYSEGSLDGARMTKILDGHRDGIYVLPYIDDSYAVTDAGKYFKICEGGEIRADRTDGLSGSVECSDCGYQIDPDECREYDGEVYCNDCVDWCEWCEETVRSASYIDGHGSICDSCQADNFTECEECYTQIEDSDIVNHDNGSHCQDCFHDRYTTCVDCDASIEHGDESTNDDGDPICEDCKPEDDDDDEDFS